MNIISQAPRWAQSTLTKLADRQPVEGLQKLPFDQDKFEQTGQGIAGIVFLASMDEVEGTDQAMGQPGVVVQEGVSLHFQGEPQGEEIEAVLQGTDQESGAEMAYYLNTGGGEIEAFGLVKSGDVVGAQGAVVTPNQNGQVDGYLIEGQVASA